MFFLSHLRAEATILLVRKERAFRQRRINPLPLFTLSRPMLLVQLINREPNILSSHTLRNPYEILDAEEFRSDELKKAAYESLDFRHDQFGRQMLKGKM